MGYDVSRTVGFDVPVCVESEDRFYFREISDRDVCKAIYSIKSNAIGDDMIPLSFVKMLLPIINHVVTHIFNSINNYCKEIS